MQVAALFRDGVGPESKKARKEIGSHLRFVDDSLYFFALVYILHALRKTSSAGGTLLKVQQKKNCPDESGQFPAYVYLTCSQSGNDALLSILIEEVDRKSTRLNSSHPTTSRMPSSA